MKIIRMTDEIGNDVCTEVFVTMQSKHKGIPLKRWKYLMTSEAGINQCPICLKEMNNSKLMSHHVVPRRARHRLRSEGLKELRMKICGECHGELHPENELILIVQALVKIIDDGLGPDAMKIERYKGIKEFIQKNFKSFSNEEKAREGQRG